MITAPDVPDRDAPRPPMIQPVIFAPAHRKPVEPAEAEYVSLASLLRDMQRNGVIVVPKGGNGTGSGLTEFYGKFPERYRQVCAQHLQSLVRMQRLVVVDAAMHNCSAGTLEDCDNIRALSQIMANTHLMLGMQCPQCSVDKSSGATTQQISEYQISDAATMITSTSQRQYLSGTSPNRFYAEIIKPLVQISNHLTIYDPIAGNKVDGIQPSPNFARSARLLLQMIDKARESARRDRYHVTLVTRPPDGPAWCPAGDLRDAWASALQLATKYPNIIVKVRYKKIWKPEFHHRYYVTERIALGIDKGLDISTRDNLLTKMQVDVLTDPLAFNAIYEISRAEDYR